MKHATLICLMAFMVFSSFGYAAGEMWFGLKLNVDADGFFHPVIHSITVEKVWPGSPAAAAGLATGDTIVEMQGIKVANAKATDLKSVLTKSSGTLQLKVRRNAGDLREVTLVAVPKA